MNPIFMDILLWTYFYRHTFIDILSYFYRPAFVDILFYLAIYVILFICYIILIIIEISSMKSMLSARYSLGILSGIIDIYNYLQYKIHNNLKTSIMGFL